MTARTRQALYEITLAAIVLLCATGVLVVGLTGNEVVGAEALTLSRAASR